MKVVFLGTSGSMPSSSRGSSSVILKQGRDLVMFDCGEGTQRQMVKGRVGFRRNMVILISHLHGDHILGLPGLIQSMSLLRREKQLDIYGPVGIIDFIKAFTETIGGPTFPVIIHEIQEQGVIHSDMDKEIIAVRSSHRITSYSYALIEKPRPGRFYPEKAKLLGIPKGSLWHKLQHGETINHDGKEITPDRVTDPSRKGRKIVYTGDTKPYSELITLAEDADLLIHESTFSEELQEEAKTYGHSTAPQAANTAKEAGVRQLVLTHISSRYYDPEVLLSEAKQVFPDVIVAEDFLEIEIPFA